MDEEVQALEKREALALEKREQELQEAAPDGWHATVIQRYDGILYCGRPPWTKKVTVEARTYDAALGEMFRQQSMHDQGITDDEIAGLNDFIEAHATEDPSGVDSSM